MAVLGLKHEGRALHGRVIKRKRKTAKETKDAAMFLSMFIESNSGEKKRKKEKETRRKDQKG